MSDLTEMLESMSGGGGGQLAAIEDPITRREAFSRLRELAAAIAPPHDMLARPKFMPGDVVRPRPGFANRKPPRCGALVVVQQFDEPVPAIAKDSGSAYFNEPLDLVIAEIDSDGDYLEFYVDSRRMEHTEPPD